MKIIAIKTKKLLAANKTEEAIRTLLDTVSSESHLYNDIVLTYSRYQDLKSHRNLGTLPFEFEQLEQNKIIKSLVSIIDKLQDNDYKEEINAVITLEKQPFNLWKWLANLWKQFKNIFSPLPY